jgi:hypothetical protein
MCLFLRSDNTEITIYLLLEKEVSSDSDVEPKKMRMDGSPTTYTRTVNRGKSRSPIDLRSPVRKLASRNSKAMSMSRSRSRSISRSRSRSISRGRYVKI